MVYEEGDAVACHSYECWKFGSPGFRGLIAAGVLGDMDVKRGIRAWR
jgi:sugar phosphate permease